MKCDFLLCVSVFLSYICIKIKSNYDTGISSTKLLQHQGKANANLPSC